MPMLYTWQYFHNVTGTKRLKPLSLFLVVTSSRKPDGSKLEKRGYFERLRSLREGMYFLMLLRNILLLQNTWLHEETPPAGPYLCHSSLFCFCFAPRILLVSNHPKNYVGECCYSRRSQRHFRIYKFLRALRPCNR